MGKWSESGVKCWLPKSSELEVGQITHFHNVDCNAYEKRIAELTAELARVKAESLRVVPDGEICDILDANSQYVTDEDGELWECHPDPADDGREVRSVLTGCGGYFTDTIVQPVRLELWGAEANNTKDDKQ